MFLNFFFIYIFHILKYEACIVFVLFSRCFAQICHVASVLHGIQWTIKPAY